MRYLVFVTNIHGHFMEYIHHIAMEISNSTRDELYIAVPETSKEKMGLFKWSNTANIHWTYFEERRVKTGRPLRDAYYSSKELSRICRMVKPDQIILLLLLASMPFLPFMIPTGCKVSGIIYNIYLYRWKRQSIFMKIQDMVKFFMLSRIKVFNKVFILNDAMSSTMLNKIWHTDKFAYLADPYVELAKGNIVDCREELGIDKGKILFSHFGSITRRKGTLYIYDIISKMSQQDRDRCCFVFAGKIWNDVKDDFYRQLETWKNYVQIIVRDEFCPYEFLGRICMSSDYVVLPYMNTCNSSGIIAYAAQFSTPVIVPAGGMVPKLVRTYHLGKVLSGNFTEAFINELPNLFAKKIQGSNQYLKEHTIEKFTAQILKR